VAANNLIPRNTPPIPGTNSAKFSKPGAYATKPTFPRAPQGDQVRDIKGQFAGGMQINWIGLEAIVTDLQEQAQKGVALEAPMAQLAKDIQQYARTNAPWQDESSAARDGLTAEVQTRPGGETAVILFHTVDYGVYLENANGGVFSIIIPTLEHFAAQMGTRLFGNEVVRGLNP
jgi:hypothetical protein